MEKTTNYNLKKPQYNEYADIMDINENMDIVDQILNGFDERLKRILTKEQTDLLYAKIAHRHNVNDIDNLIPTIKGTKVNNAIQSDNAEKLRNMIFNWSGQGGQPLWVWGGADGTNMFVYNPANFNVNYANAAGNANSIHGFQFRNNNGRLEVLINGVWLSVGGQIYNRLKEYNSIEVLGGAREGIQSQYQMGQEVVLFDMWKPLKITSLTWGNPQASTSLGYSYRGISFSRVRVWLDEVLVFDDNNIPSQTNYTDRGPLRPSQYTETRYVEARSHLKIIATIANNAGNVHPALELKMMYYE